MTAKVLSLPWPDKALSSNSRAHWGEKARATKAARGLAHMSALEKPALPTWPKAHIFIEYYPKTYRGDPQNVPTSLKAYIDGIADAMRCDDRQFKVDYPNQFAGKSEHGKVIFRIVPSREDEQANHDRES